jgi:choline dehydrogenase-like flavoprotein
MVSVSRLANERAASMRRSVARALMRGIMAPELPREAPALALAAERLEDFLAAVDNQAAVTPLRVLLLALYGYVRLRYGRAPDALDDTQLAALLAELSEPQLGPLGRTLERARKLSPLPLPSVRDLTRGLREMLTTAYYSTAGTDHVTGYTQLWNRPEARAVMPELAPPPERLPVVELLEKQRVGRDVPVEKLFANDGRPRVAIIGSGAGGAVAAARLAQSCDVAVFEAGPAFVPSEYPLDTMAGLALLFRDGLMTFSQSYSLQLLLGRLVGGSTVLTSGMSIRTRSSTLAAWQRAGLSLPAMHAALDAVEQRCRLAPLNEELVSDLGRIWRGQNGDQNRELMFEVPLSNTVTHARQHLNDPHGSPYRRGERCLACGLCNYGCRFGHKLSVELTFLPDARALGARVHPNLEVERRVATRDPSSGSARISGLVLKRDKRAAPIPVDHVVLAAGAIGSPQLLLRSMQHSQALAQLPCAAQVGRHLGFNYGSTVVADYGRVPAKPGGSGIQIHYVASKPEDERFVLENAYLPPALMASVVPGNGAEHRAWMKSWAQLSMIAPTIGSPSRGAVLPNGQVSYEFGQGELEIIHEALVTSIRSYLRAGAQRVGLAGVRAYDESASTFRPGDDDAPGALLDKVRRVVPHPDRLMMMSAHPQGGLRLGRDPADSVVSPRYQVHGVGNLSVVDASLFPSTIVVNPQWTVMSLAWVAAEQIAAHIAGQAQRPAARAAALGAS